MTREKTVIVGVYGPGMERSENERDAFWECFNACINGFSENGRIVVENYKLKTSLGAAWRTM